MYKLKFLRKAVRELRKIDVPQQKIIKAKLEILAQNPEALANNITRLAGTNRDYYRLRVGNRRVIYERRDDELIIIVIRIGHRREASSAKTPNATSC